MTGTHPDLVAKLSDFMLAIEARPEVPLGFATSQYMSCEKHLPLSYGLPSDIWSAGVILYEMFVGCYPFPLVKDIKYNPPLPMPSKVPDDIQWLIMNMLDKDPHKRMTATEIQDWLRNRQDSINAQQKQEEAK